MAWSHCFNLASALPDHFRTVFYRFAPLCGHFGANCKAFLKPDKGDAKPVLLLGRIKILGLSRRYSSVGN
jgi:hypothetical protein